MDALICLLPVRLSPVWSMMTACPCWLPFENANRQLEGLKKAQLCPE